MKKNYILRKLFGASSGLNFELKIKAPAGNEIREFKEHHSLMREHFNTENYFESLVNVSLWRNDVDS